MDWITFSNNTGLYLYSALLQANAAILSLIGIYFIFKIQSLKSEIEAIKNYVFHNSGSSAAKTYYFDFDLVSILDKKQIIDKLIETKQIEKDPYHKFSLWLSKETDIVLIIMSVKFPSLILAISIMIDAIFLVFAYQIHLQKYPYEILSFASILLLQLFTLIIIIRGIFKVMRVSR